MRTDPGDSRRLDDCFARDYARNIGAEVMGQQVRAPARALARPRVARLVGWETSFRTRGGLAGELGSGLRLWESRDELLDRFHPELVPSPSGVTRHLFWRK